MCSNSEFHALCKSHIVLDRSKDKEDAATATDGSDDTNQSQKTLDLRGIEVHLTEVFYLHKFETLCIKGAKIVADESVHSIFILNSQKKHKPALCLIDCELVHKCSSSNVRDIGACVFAMGKARVSINNSILTTHGGFGVWLKHEASAALLNTSINGGRTGIAMFNISRLFILGGCSITSTSIHGLCMRANTSTVIYSRNSNPFTNKSSEFDPESESRSGSGSVLTSSNSAAGLIVTSAMQRGVYVYGNATCILAKVDKVEEGFSPTINDNVFTTTTTTAAAAAAAGDCPVDGTKSNMIDSEFISTQLIVQNCPEIGIEISDLGKLIIF